MLKCLCYARFTNNFFIIVKIKHKSEKLLVSLNFQIRPNNFGGGRPTFITMAGDQGKE